MSHRPAIIAAMRSGAITVAGIAAITGRTKSAVQQLLYALEDDGVVENSGPLEGAVHIGTWRLTGAPLPEHPTKTSEARKRPCTLAAVMGMALPTEIKPTRVHRLEKGQR